MLDPVRFNCPKCGFGVVVSKETINALGADVGCSRCPWILEYTEEDMKSGISREDVLKSKVTGYAPVPLWKDR
jgi:hypothetical protein